MHARRTEPKLNRPVAFSVVLMLGIGLCPAGAAAADPTTDRSTAVPATDTDLGCGLAIQRSTSLNGGQLFEGAEACAGAEASDDAVFLLLAGQVRALTDMSLLTPDSDADQAAAAELYGALYYKYGGSGPDELFRDADRATAMFERLRNWRPEFSASYSPAWDYQRPVEIERYQLMVDYSTRNRLAKLESYRNLLQDDRYYAVHREHRELLARNNNRTVAGTDDADRIAELQELLDTISASIARVPEPPLPKELQPDYAPNPDAEFEQLHAGFNGIEGSGLAVFDSRADALGSWLTDALPAADLQSLLDEVDFDRQHLVVLSFPPADAATGKLYLRDIAYRPGRRSISVTGVMGANEEDCTEPKARSHPFVIASTPKPSFQVEAQYTGFSTVPDGCRPTIAAD